MASFTRFVLPQACSAASGELAPRRDAVSIRRRAAWAAIALAKSAQPESALRIASLALE
jgi:hypothetical protein